MELSQFILIVKKRKKVLFFAVLFFLALAAIITFRSSLDYRASARLLIVQNTGVNTPLDPYVVAQANKYLSGVLTQVTGSNAFYEQVSGSGFNFDRSFFSGEQASRLDKWRRTVEAFAAADTGIIEIRVYHPDKQQAQQLAQAIVYTMTEKHAEYHSSGGKVSLKVIDQPLVSDYPVRPDLFLTFGSALLLGFSFGLFYVYIFSAEMKYLPQNVNIYDYAQDQYPPAPAKNLQPIEPFEQEAKFPTAPPASRPPLRQEQNYQSAPPADGTEAARERQPSPDQAIGRGDMRNVLSHKGL